MKGKLELCETSDKCDRCDLAYLLKDYVHPLIQLLSDDLDEYNMQLQTTKCLNTGVMLMFFMAGKKRGLEVTEYCDSVNVVNRHREKIDVNKVILSKLMSRLFSTNFKARQVYYILLSDGYFHNGDSQLYFPGHVFILEKFRVNGSIFFNIYQSYVNEYDLDGHFKNMNGTMRMTYKQTMSLLNKLAHIILNGRWDTVCSRYWKDITSVDASKYENHVTTDNIYICFKAVPLKHCINNIQKYVKQKLKSFHTIPESPHKNALSKTELKDRLSTLLSSITQKSE